MTWNGQKLTFKTIIPYLLIILLILPARCFNGYYLKCFEVPSNISVHYLNLIDAYILLLTILCMITCRYVKKNRNIWRPVIVYCACNCLMMIVLLCSGSVDYIGELFSKTNIVICTGLIVNTIAKLSDNEKTKIYIGALLVLVTASFFLSDYKGYRIMNRVGSLGFGSNETASFACSLLAISLFTIEMSIGVRIGLFLLSATCILNVASRRGIVVAVGIIALWVIMWFIKRKHSKIRLRNLINIIVVITLLLIVWKWKGRDVLSYIDSSALFTRFHFAIKYGENVMDYSNRESIYHVAIKYMQIHPFFGSMGCDLVYATEGRTHTHNLFLQLIITHGVFLGLIFSGYVVSTTYKAFVNIRAYLMNREGFFSFVCATFFLVYFVFEGFGYLLWNPKGLFWIFMTMLFINIEYNNTI